MTIAVMLTNLLSTSMCTTTVTKTQDEIALHLCGIANEDLANDFMNGDESVIEAFLSNVSFCSRDSAPYILWAINAHLMEVAHK